MSRLLLPAVAAIALLAASAKPAQAQFHGYPAGSGFGYSPYYGGNGLTLGLGGLQLNFGSSSNYGYYPYSGYSPRYYSPNYGSSWNRNYGNSWNRSYGNWNNGNRNRGWSGGRRGWRR